MNKLIKHENNWKVKSHFMDKEWRDLVIKDKKLKDPIYIQILVPNKPLALNTIHLLYYKIQKDLKIDYLGSEDFLIERKRLPEVRKYVSDYYGSYIKDITARRKVRK